MSLGIEDQHQDGQQISTKRRKLENGHAPAKPIASIFAPFRTIGLISSTSVPFASQALGKTTFQITTSIGRCLHTYDLRRGLNLVFITRPQTPSLITATCAWKDRVLAAWGGGNGSAGGIWAYKRGQVEERLEYPQDADQEISRLFIFGSWIVGGGQKRIEIWNSTTLAHHRSMTLDLSHATTASNLTGCITHMPTYLNKIFVGTIKGTVEIWNVSTGKHIYTIKSCDNTASAITALEPSPALGILAIAHANGSLQLYDVQNDVSILKLEDSESSPRAVSSISFRTDGLGAGKDGTKSGIMATASHHDGDIVLWDLNKGGRIRGTLRGAHLPPSKNGRNGGINRVEFLAGQDVMITSGMDNALKSWIFDANSLTSTPRILHSRSGHSAPVICLKWLPTSSDGADWMGKWLMSASRDQSLWGWSLRKDGQSTELSQGAVQKKAKKLGLFGARPEDGASTTLNDLKAAEIISIACSMNRDGGMGTAGRDGGVWTNVVSKKGASDASESSLTGWESVVTAHRGDTYARTWSWGRKKAGRWAFPSGDGTEVSSVGITPCGTFALVGSAGGHLSMYNLQSGIFRQSFPAPIAPAQARKLKFGQPNGASSTSAYGPGQGKHRKAVTGIVVDSINKTVTSCGLDGKLKFWDFSNGQIQAEVDWSSITSIVSMRFERHSDLIALSCNDLCIRVVDTQTKKTVRELWGSLGQINDLCFSNDGRWIIAASMDSILRVWDLPTGHLINALQMESPCSSLAFSETGEYLATAHADSIGINIWNNRTLFTNVPTRLLREDEFIPVRNPTSSGEGGQSIVDVATAADINDTDADAENTIDYLPSDPLHELDSSLLSLSLVPKSRWQNLMHLDAIRHRNKPKEPPKKPEKAPFFLSAALDRAGMDPFNAIADNTQLSTAVNGTTSSSRISKITAFSTQSSTNPFTSLLHSCKTSGDYEPLTTHLSTLAPSAADIEIRSLTPDELPIFVQALTYRLRQRRDFELVQAWMNVFLKLHGEILLHDPEDETANGAGSSHESDSDETGEKSMTLRAALEEWRDVHVVEQRRLNDLLGYCTGVLSFVASSR